MSTPFFSVNDSAFVPFMRDEVEIASHAGTVTVRASVLLTQKDGSSVGLAGDIFAVTFRLRDWRMPELPTRGSVLTFGHPARTLYILQVQQVDALVHITATENPSVSY